MFYLDLCDILISSLFRTVIYTLFVQLIEKNLFFYPFGYIIGNMISFYIVLKQNDTLKGSVFKKTNYVTRKIPCTKKNYFFEEYVYLFLFE